MFVFVRATNVSKMWDFMTAKLLLLYSGPSVVSGRCNENFYELASQTTREVVGSYNLKPYNTPLGTFPTSYHARHGMASDIGPAVILSTRVLLSIPTQGNCRNGDDGVAVS
ncbi:hypothetical protein PR048_019550 [Dryococelus australis]|uniref:Uncharacterized protein n=1 Tax=Dryococelus australis TaxID=614101 RepID=A0ABQ9H421_9NEOP|nr:hypothetical protein PR048_019550 [Dryococelus australis]